MEWFLDVPVWIRAALAFIFGAIIGSFLNVCIHRIPKEQEIVRTPSHCPHCGARIPWYLNIPIISWIGLRGRAACCGERIAFRYPLIELAAAAVTSYLFLQLGFSLELLAAWLFACILIVLLAIDWEELRLPNVLTLPGIALGLVFAAFGVRIELVDGIIGALAGAGSLLLVALYFQWRRGREMMGMGDVKLMAMIGLFLGWRHTILVIIFGSVVGIVYFVIFAARGPEGTKTRLPFGSFLCLAALLDLLWGGPIMAAYISIITPLQEALTNLISNFV